MQQGSRRRGAASLAWILGMSVMAVVAGAGEEHNKSIGVALLPGYSAKKHTAIDARAWEITAPQGTTIVFESGMNEGSWASPEKQDTYSWYREQTVNGRHVRLALVKRGLRTVWEPRGDPGKPPGNVLLVTFQLVPGDWDYTANFAAKVASQEDLADVLLIVMTFNPAAAES